MIVISVILTTYNSSKTLVRALHSIFHQEGIGKAFEIELLVIDDCSTDNTPQILKEHNISYHTTEKNTGGPNHGRNIGLKLATGDFICIMDHDDEWLPHKLQMQLSVVNLAPIISSGYFVIDELEGKLDKRVQKSNDSKKYIFYAQDQTFLDRLSKSKSGQHTYFGSIMFSSKFKHLLFEEKFGMVDYDWILRLFQGNSSVEILEPLYNRYVFGSNLSLNERYRHNDYTHSIETIAAFQKQFPSEAKQGIKRVNGTMARYFFIMGNMKMARYYFLKDTFSIKTVLYYLSTYVGHNLVKRRFKVFG